MNPWIKTYERVPPLNRYVEILYKPPCGDERTTKDILISMMNGSYMYRNGNYSDCEVVAWREIEV